MFFEENECAICVKDLVKKYGEHTVINNLNFMVPKNKITTILGFSGAGKSTLMKHLLGLERPTSGEITVLGQNLSTLKDIGLREFRKNFGMVFQYAALFDSLSAFENVAFPLREFTKKNNQEIFDIVSELLISVNIQKEAFDRLPSELSGGMRKRVGLARALALKPSIMLYDEPTTGLDPITTKTVNDLIYETSENYKSKGFTSIIISHDVKATLEISDFVAFLDRGKIIEYLPCDKFVKSQNSYVRRFLELEGF